MEKKILGEIREFEEHLNTHLYPIIQCISVYRVKKTQSHPLLHVKLNPNNWLGFAGVYIYSLFFFFFFLEMANDREVL